MFDQIVEAGKDSWIVTCEMAPYLLFGFLAAGILSAFVSPDIVRKHLGQGRFLPAVKAATFGVPLPLCSCGVIPVTASLRKNGASRGAATAFLLSTPQTGVDSIFATFSILGPVFAIVRPICALISGIISGVMLSIFIPEDNKTGIESRAIPDTKPKTTLIYKAREALTYGFIELPRSIGKPVLIGLAATGVITAVIPDDFFAGYLGAGIGAMFVMILLGTPIYICSTASVPIAAALMVKGISPGAALVFLMTGPATNATAIATVWKVMGKGSTAVYIFTCTSVALASGLLLDHFFPDLLGSLFLSTNAINELTIESWKIVAGVVLLAVIAGPLIFSRKVVTSHGASNISLEIEGMTCGHCKQTVTKALDDCEGVLSVEVSLKNRTAHVNGDRLDLEKLTHAVEFCGFKVSDSKQN